MLTFTLCTTVAATNLVNHVSHLGEMQAFFKVPPNLRLFECQKVFRRWDFSIRFDFS